MPKIFRSSLLVLCACLVAFTSCDRTEDERNDLKDQIVANYAAMVYANYQDALEGAQTLDVALEAFVASPSEATLTAAKNAWLASREPYGVTEAYRFGEGPIDDADGPEGLMNAWPLDEAYIDYVSGNANVGIVNNTAITIDMPTLESLNEVGAEENVSIGFHAIEFLLWGQDDPNTALLTPGQRPFTDFVTGANGTAANQDRRGAYLLVCGDLLIKHLQSLVDEWNPNGGAYYATFTALDRDEAIRRMLTGIGILSKSELAGERIFTALDNADQEDEHSCFADNTHRDIVTNAIGIRNVYLGLYTRTNNTVVSGPSLRDLANDIDATLNADLEALLNSAVAATEAIPVPFDFGLTQEAVGGSGPIQSSVTALQAAGDKIAEVASAMGITISTDLPE
ncbi:MAG: imelysin family protein [Bacteroidota bacterium]